MVIWEDNMNVALEGSGTLSHMDLSVARCKGIVIGFWIVTALFCLQIGFTAYAQLRLPQVAEAFTHLGFPDYFRVELSLAKLLGVVLLLAPAPPRLKEWAYAGFASIPSRATSRWRSSAARRCVLSSLASPSTRKCATLTSARTTCSTRRRWRRGSGRRPPCPAGSHRRPW